MIARAKNPAFIRNIIVYEDRVNSFRYFLINLMLVMKKLANMPYAVQ